jgi:hypothetical protein
LNLPLPSTKITFSVVPVGTAEAVIAATSIDDPDTRTFFQLAIVYYFIINIYIPKKKSPDAE